MEFVCDFCENKVAITDASCSVCGGVFSDVKCPECDYRGRPSKFDYGCPRCHYNGMGMLKVHNPHPHPYSFFNYWVLISYLGFSAFFIMWLILYRFMG